ncbi:hypothetical protein F5Y00DRAFT_207824 [Daldinia vernicosa]|uniref:uncharacterized protein n=1 Tax=Daldinia vernicosa TaxID=114800 RepID=UPI002007F359|nr:uncharacterized protein F5Y00DRAFT_207824 [Daldinia vernicosa]KAI0852122.1 hypothetical protein F5Y00DRAFT_207824 [Daldinia vernicosa]
MESSQLPSNGDRQSQSPNRESTSPKGKHENTQRASLATVAQLDDDGRSFYDTLLTPWTTTVESDHFTKWTATKGGSHNSPTNVQQPQASTATTTVTTTVLHEYRFGAKKKQGRNTITWGMNRHSALSLAMSLSERGAVKSPGSSSLTDIQAASLKLPELRTTQPSQADEKPELPPLKQLICEAKTANKRRKRKGKREVGEPANKNCLGTPDQDMSQNGSLNGCSLPNMQAANPNDEDLISLAEVAVSRCEAMKVSEEKKADFLLGVTDPDIQSLPGAADVVSSLSTESKKTATKTISEKHNETTQDSASEGLSKDETQPTRSTRENIESVVVEDTSSTRDSLSQANTLYESMSTRETSPSNNDIQESSEVGRSKNNTLRGPEQDTKMDESVERKGTPLNGCSKKSGSLKDKTEEEEEAIAAKERRKKEKNTKKRERERRKARERWENKQKMERAKQELKEARRTEQERLELEKLEKLEEVKKAQIRELKYSEGKAEVEQPGTTREPEYEIGMAEKPGDKAREDEEVREHDYPATQREQDQVSRGEASHSEIRAGGKCEESESIREWLQEVREHQENKPLKSYQNDDEINPSPVQKVNRGTKLPDREREAEPILTTYVTDESKSRDPEETEEVITGKVQKSRNEVDDAKKLSNGAHNQLEYQQISDPQSPSSPTGFEFRKQSSSPGFSQQLDKRLDAPPTELQYSDQPQQRRLTICSSQIEPSQPSLISQQPVQPQTSEAPWSQSQMSQPLEAPQASQALLGLLRGPNSKGKAKQASPDVTIDRPSEVDTRRQYFEVQYPQPSQPQYYNEPMPRWPQSLPIPQGYNRDRTDLYRNGQMKGWTRSHQSRHGSQESDYASRDSSTDSQGNSSGMATCGCTRESTAGSSRGRASPPNFQRTNREFGKGDRRSRQDRYESGLTRYELEDMAWELSVISRRVQDIGSRLWSTTRRTRGSEY